MAREARSRSSWVARCGVLGLVAASAWAAAPAASTLSRTADPVVLSGADVARLVGAVPGDIVAWRYDGGWQQIPVQVDERDVRDWGLIYHMNPIGVSALVYTDPGTFTGPDTDPTLDGNDEIVFMVRDAGGAAPPFDEPPGVLAESGVEVVAEDPLDGGSGLVYLFRQEGGLDPGAGQAYVDYEFVLLSGDYRATYDTTSGPNPEESRVLTPFYAHHFSDRWIDDELQVLAGDASGTDILDRHKDQFAPGNCARTENTFSNGEGAFVVNSGGPVRALRSYLGANSGPLTQREHKFYEARHDMATFLRVHAISGVVDYFDYSPQAIGMTYANDRNPGGVTIDGLPETPAAGMPAWELVEGEQGALILLHDLVTDIPNLGATSYYLDDATPSVTQCTGDPWAYGASGPWIASSIPCTDPAACPGTFNVLITVRRLYYGAPGATIADAAVQRERADRPLRITVRAWPPPFPGTVPATGPGAQPLTVARSETIPGWIELSWGEGCVPGVATYAVYEGEVGDFASHVPVDCQVSGPSLTVSPGSGDRYYLVVPVADGVEGSYGTRSDGQERPPSVAACAPQVTGECPRAP